MPGVIDPREKIERDLEMLRYSVENTESMLAMYQEGELERTYAQKLLDSCRALLAAKEEEYRELLKKEGGKA